MPTATNVNIQAVYQFYMSAADKGYCAVCRRLTELIPMAVD